MWEYHSMTNIWRHSVPDRVGICFNVEQVRWRCVCIHASPPILTLLVYTHLGYIVRVYVVWDKCKTSLTLFPSDLNILYLLNPFGIFSRLKIIYCEWKAIYNQSDQVMCTIKFLSDPIIVEYTIKLLKMRCLRIHRFCQSHGCLLRWPWGWWELFDTDARLVPCTAKHGVHSPQCEETMGSSVQISANILSSQSHVIIEEVWAK